jgi:HK97 family phage portal protein
LDAELAEGAYSAVMGIRRWLQGPDLNELMDPEYRVTSGLSNPSNWLVDALSVATASSGEKVTQQKALGLAAVFSAVEKISEAVGSLPFKVYRMVDDDTVEARGHRSWRMLHDKPNSETTARTYWSTVAAQLLLEGDSLSWKERDPFTGEVESLYLLDNSQFMIEWDGGVKVFKNTQTGRKFGSDQILHIMGFSLNGVNGCSRIAYCRETLGTALGRARFEGEFYAHGARFPGVIEYPGRLGEQGTKNLANAMAARHGGPGNRHKVPVLEENATFKSVGMSLQDMQFVENAQMSKADIATMFGLPAAYLNASSGDSLTYATTESNQIQFGQMAVAPISSRIASAVTHDPGILPQNVMYAEHTLEALYRADMKTRAEYWASMKSTLGLDPAYIARRENIPQSALVEPEPAPPMVEVEEIEEAEVMPLQIAPRAEAQ